jgi:hypothetical protein
MKKFILLFMLTPLLMATTCDSDDNQIVCTQEVKAGLAVTVSLGSMSSIVSEGVGISQLI